MAAKLQTVEWDGCYAAAEVVGARDQRLDPCARNDPWTVAFLLPTGTIVDQLAWVVVAAAVAIATSTLVARRRVAEVRLSHVVAQEQARRGEAESQNEKKSAFLAQVAHELRQPLGAITTAAGLLEAATVPPQRKAARSA